MTCEHDRKFVIEIDRVTVRGKLFVRYSCEVCDEGDWWEDENGNEADPFADDDPGGLRYKSRNVMALYKTTGPRSVKHKAVLYLRVDRDWTGRNLERNGHQISRPVMEAQMPLAALKACGQRKRAWSLQYDGFKPCDPAGLRDDVLSLGVSEDVAKEFEEAFRKVMEEG